jgi:predicted nucleic acid-binding protein
MIVVDTSVWIPYVHGHTNEQVERLLGLPRLRDVIIGDLVAMEVLQGARSERIARDIEREFLEFEQRVMGGIETAYRAAEFYRTLRGLGITVRSGVDMMIAAYCIELGHELLHNDRDFDHFEKHFGLKVLR